MGVILYSETSDHCAATGLSNLPTIGGILTTTDTMTASSLAKLALNQASTGTASILPDLNSYTNSSSGGWNGSSSLGQSPTTAVAMIILYSITGVITALFVVIIVTGAIRAHRHPERYGPRNIVGRGRQSRAKGVARAMLETLPLCAGVNVLAARRVFGEEIPVESCLKFFQDYREAIRHTFIVHSVLFWASSFVMLFLLLLRPVVDGNTRHRDADVDTEHQNTKRNTNKGIRAWGRWWAWTILAIFSLQLVLFILIFHHFVPEQVLRKEAGGQLDEGKMTFGQILTIFMWASVLVDVASKDRAGTRMS